MTGLAIRSLLGKIDPTYTYFADDTKESTETL